MGPNAMLIQIMDPPGNFPIPKHQFKEVHQFDFLDIEDTDVKMNQTMVLDISQSLGIQNQLLNSKIISMIIISARCQIVSNHY